MGDHGGILVMTDDQKPTDIIYYSWDQGLNWKTIQLQKQYQFTNIITEPSNTGTHFLAYGFESDMQKGALLTFNFSDLH